MRTEDIEVNTIFSHQLESGHLLYTQFLWFFKEGMDYTWWLPYHAFTTFSFIIASIWSCLNCKSVLVFKAATLLNLLIFLTASCCQSSEIIWFSSTVLSLSIQLCLRRLLSSSSTILVSPLCLPSFKPLFLLVLLVPIIRSLFQELKI